MNELKNLDFCNKTIQFKKDIEKNFLLLGEHLKSIRDAQLYKPQWENFMVYCEELDMSESTASKLINIYEVFVLTLGIPTAELTSTKGWSSLAEALPLVKSKEEADRILHLRETLTAKDFRDTIRAEKRGTSLDTCDHADSYLVRVCRTCGGRHQEFPENIKNE